MGFQPSKDRAFPLSRDMTIRFPAAQAGLFTDFVQSTGLVHETGTPRTGEGARVVLIASLYPARPARFHLAVALQRNAVFLLSGLLARSTANLRDALLAMLARDSPLTAVERAAFTEVALAQPPRGTRSASKGPDPARLHLTLDGWLFDRLQANLLATGQADHAPAALRATLLRATQSAAMRRLLVSYGAQATKLRASLEAASEKAIAALADEIMELFLPTNTHTTHTRNFF